MNIQTYAKIKDKNLIEFFELHSEIDDLRKGFVVLGYLINFIVWKQKKDSKTSTFLTKIDYDGTDKERLRELLNELKEYIFNIYYKKDLFVGSSEIAFVDEIISKYFKEDGINLPPEEVTFYILLGVNLGQFIGIKKGEEYKQNLEEGKND